MLPTINSKTGEEQPPVKLMDWNKLRKIKIKKKKQKTTTEGEENNQGQSQQQSDESKKEDEEAPSSGFKLPPTDGMVLFIQKAVKECAYEEKNPPRPSYIKVDVSIEKRWQQLTVRAETGQEERWYGGRRRRRNSAS